jgi:hypothetical protein
MKRPFKEFIGYILFLTILCTCIFIITYAMYHNFTMSLVLAIGSFALYYLWWDHETRMNQ